MLRNLKIKHPENDVWFTSDLHWGHDRPWIVEARGFKTVEDHDKAIVDRWNETCKDHSIVFSLGDICFNDSKGDRLHEFIRRVNFSKLYLLLGNHTSGHSAVYKDLMYYMFPWSFDGETLVYEVYPLEWRFGHKRVIFLPEYIEVEGFSDRLVLCHYPIISHHKMGHGSLHLCGHSHGACEYTNARGIGKRLDVGIDSFGKPINLTEIKRILSSRKIDSPDHHGRPAPE